MNAEATRTSAAISDHEVLTTRVVPFTREQVFGAFADPAKLTRWWGPNGFTSTFHEFDFRPGGAWRFTFHGPDGAEYKNISAFDVLERPGRVVLRHLSGPTYRATFDFEERGETTAIRWHMRFDNAEFLAKHKDLVVGANHENLDRLEGVLRESPPT